MDRRGNGQSSKQNKFLLRVFRNNLPSFKSKKKKKGTETVTGAVPFQKVNFCPF